LKRKKKISVELALTNLNLTEPVLELVTFDDGDPLKGPSFALANVDLRLDMKEERAMAVVVILMILT
jgi:hypothetical protein